MAMEEHFEGDGISITFKENFDLPHIALSDMKETVTVFEQPFSNFCFHSFGGIPIVAN